MAENKLIFGILSTLRYQGQQPFAGQSEPFAELLEIARRRKITAYVFTKENIDWQQQRVTGWVYRNKPVPGWRQRFFPLPAVIYNRIPSRALESQPAMQEFLALLKNRYGPRFFNPGFLDKWKTYRCLAGVKRIGCYIPETQLVTSPQTVSQLLTRHGDIYLKPRANSLGIGISRIIRIPGGKYACRTRLRNGEVSTATFTAAEDLLASLPLWQKDVSYLAQQTVKLTCYRNRPFDIRLLAQKDRCGQWRKTGWAARVAGPDSVTTHVIYGGEGLPVSTVLGSRYYARARAKAKIMAGSVPKIIENAWQSYFGEMEMDVAVDANGNLWLLEVNAKPFKFDESLLRTKSLLRLTDYACYLAENTARCPTGGENHENSVFIRQTAQRPSINPAHV